MSCTECNKKIDCESCGCKSKCRRALPVIGVEEMPDNIAMLKFNLDGATTYYDYRNMIHQTETDTTLSLDATKRALNYHAERHTDAISAHELGAIFHLADLGDVDVTGVSDGSMLVYHKDNNCAEGCEGISNAWTAWNALEQQTDSLEVLFGAKDDNRPYTLATPANSDEYYMVGWNGNNKVSYSQPQETTIGAVTGTDDKVSILVEDPNTKQIMSIKVSAEKLQELLGE